MANEIFGMKIVEDASIPENEAHFKLDGKVVGKIIDAPKGTKPSIDAIMDNVIARYPVVNAYLKDN